MTDPKNLENRLHEKADPARAVSTGRVRYTLAELLADAEASGAYPLPPRNANGWMRRLWVGNGQTVKIEKGGQFEWPPFRH